MLTGMYPAASPSTAHALAQEITALPALQLTAPQGFVLLIQHPAAALPFTWPAHYQVTTLAPGQPLAGACVYDRIVLLASGPLLAAIQHHPATLLQQLAHTLRPDGQLLLLSARSWPWPCPLPAWHLPQPLNWPQELAAADWHPQHHGSLGFGRHAAFWQRVLPHAGSLHWWLTQHRPPRGGTKTTAHSSLPVLNSHPLPTA